MTPLSTTTPLKVLLFPVGSAGDVYPHIGLGRELRRRGHDVTLLTSGYFRKTAEREGLRFVDILSEDKFIKLASNPRLWDPLRGTKTIFDSYDRETIRVSYQAAIDHYEPGNTVALTSCIGFGPRIAHDHVGLPLITVDLQPMVLWSVHETPVLPGFARSGWVPKWFKRMQYWIAEKYVLDRMICPAINSCRTELGLAPVNHVTHWWHSPQCILALWPAWYGPRQPDWPPQVQLTQFPLWTEQVDEVLPNAIEKFLSAGDPPIVFTPGSANMFGKAFFQAATDACQRLGRRGMLFSRFQDHIPTNLPDSVCHFPYAPFQTLLPRTAAISHHGGIGTTANAMAAGIPQLIMPLSHDQPDNALRLKNLGIADSLRPRHYRGANVAARLDRLLHRPKVAEACRRVADRFVGTDPFLEACNTVEDYAKSVQLAP